MSKKWQSLSTESCQPYFGVYDIGIPRTRDQSVPRNDAPNGDATAKSFI